MASQRGRSAKCIRAAVAAEVRSSCSGDERKCRSLSPPTDVDRGAPVLAHHEVDIRAPLGVVWQLHTDVDAWPTWHGDITEAHSDGAFERGTSFTWTSFGFTVTSTIYEVTEQSRVLWGGTADGITGIHAWAFEETPAGVHVTTNESFAGQPVESDPSAMQTMLDGSLVGWLGHLKAAGRVPGVSGSCFVRQRLVMSRPVSPTLSSQSWAASSSFVAASVSSGWLMPDQ